MQNKISNPIIKEVVTYGLVGLSALAVQDIFYIITMSMQSHLTCETGYCNIFNSHLALVAMFIGNLLGLFVSYTGHNKFTFKKEKRCYKEFIKLSITSGIGLVFNLLCTYLLINMFQLNHNFGLIPTFIAPVITYSISKFWVFK